MARVEHLLLVGSPETNKVMEAELSRLCRRALSKVPARPSRAGSGTLVYPFDSAVARTALAYHRTSTRLLAELYRLQASRLEPLYDELVADVAADDRPWVSGGAGISIRARNVGQFAAGARQIVGTVKNAVIDGMARRGIALKVAPHNPDLELVVRMHDHELSVSLDLAGRSLSQRGYRREAGEAPLREHLAAVLLMLARWDPRREPLIDPMCGSGTIAIEAALMARAVPRPDAAALVARTPLLGELSGRLEPLFGDTVPEIRASDRDREVVAMAARNAAAAGAGEQVAPEARDLFSIARDDLPERSGLILSNPPYGARLGGRELGSFYRRLGQWCRGLNGYRFGFLVGDPDGSGELVRALGMRPRIRKPLANGPIRGHFLLYET